MCIIQEKSSQNLVGICGMAKRDFIEDGPALAYALDSEYCGKGYAVEACREFARVASDCGYKKMYASVKPVNYQSVKVLVNLGMVLEDSKEQEGR